MKTIILANLFVFVIVSGIVVFNGLDLKKLSSWLFGVYGFLSGLSINILYPTDAFTSLEAGAFFAFIVLAGGAMNPLAKRAFQAIKFKYCI
jgi:hypothetical protein